MHRGPRPAQEWGGRERRGIYSVPIWRGDGILPAMVVIFRLVWTGCRQARIRPFGGRRAAARSASGAGWIRICLGGCRGPGRNPPVLLGGGGGAAAAPPRMGGRRAKGGGGRNGGPGGAGGVG